MNDVIKKVIKNNIICIILFFIITIVLWIISLVIPFMTGKYIDLLINNEGMDIIYRFTAIFIIAILIQIIFSYYSNILSVKLNNNISFEITNYSMNYIKKVQLNHINKYNSGYLSQRITTDSSLVTSFLISTINIVINLFTLIFIIYYIFNANFKLAIIFILLIPFYICQYKIFKKPLYDKNYKLKESKNNFFAILHEQISTIKLMKMNSWFSEYENDLKNGFNVLFKDYIKYSKTMYLFNNVGVFISSIGCIVLFLFGGILVIKKVLSVGVFMTINSYFKTLYSTVGYFLNIIPAYQEALVSYKRLNEILIVPQENNGDINLSDVYKIKINNLSFAYEKGKMLINKFNYTFNKGNIYCINGENGKGKSTFINILTGLFNDYQGEIIFDSYNLKELDLYNTRKNLIGVLEQESKLLNSNLLNNITYGIYNKDNSEINMWCEMFNLINNNNSWEKFINYKYNNELISGGQKQKICIIRTLLKDSKVIIMDEPTSYLDEESIEKLKYILSKIKNEKIIILITHNKMLWDISDYNIYI